MRDRNLRGQRFEVLDDLHETAASLQAFLRSRPSLTDAEQLFIESHQSDRVRAAADRRVTAEGKGVFIQAMSGNQTAYQKSVTDWPRPAPNWAETNE